MQSKLQPVGFYIHRTKTPYSF